MANDEYDVSRGNHLIFIQPYADDALVPLQRYLLHYELEITLPASFTSAPHQENRPISTITALSSPAVLRVA